jgi:tRNA (cmo5U34)-methyltransferase
MASPTQTPGQGEVRAGHWWKEEDRVKSYVEANDAVADQIAAVFDLITQVLPYDRQAQLRVLDIGTGHGVFAGAILDAFPNASAIGLDISDAMMEEGKQRMARFGDRFRYHVGDFADGSLPADLPGPFDVTVSSRAIHHITLDAKRRLFGDILQRTNAGGCFVDLDNMRPKDPFLVERYRAVPDPGAAPRQPRPEGEARPAGGREHPDAVEDQLAILREVGFAHVDLVWKRLGRSVIAGFKE